MSHRVLEFKIVLIGAVAVGKTAIANVLQFQAFDPEYQPTIGAGFIPLEKKINGKNIELQIWDTAGMDQYRSLAPIHYRGANCAVIVFDQTNPSSADELNVWLDAYREIVTSTSLISIVANKDDLPNKNVNLKPIREWAENNNFIFQITSAKEQRGINELFDIIAKQLVERPDIKPAMRHERIKQGNTDNKGCSC